MDKYLLGIDIGTSTVKACCYDEEFNLIAGGKCRYPTYFGNASQAEQDPDEWWMAVCDSIAQINRIIDGKGEIVGISISSHSPVLLPLDYKGNVLRKAMIWMDRRAEKEKEEAAYKLIGYERYKRILCAEPDAYYVLPKLLWLRKHEPEIYRKASVYLQANGYIVYRLTGEFSIDLIHGVSVQGMDFNTWKWSPEISEAVDFDFNKYFPKICMPSEIVGFVSEKAAEATGLKKGTPVAAGATDTIAAYYGYGTHNENCAAEMTGTSSLLYFNINKKLDDYGKMLVKPSFTDPGNRILVSAINASGASVEWFRRIFADTDGNPLDYLTMNTDAEKAEAGSGKVIYFPYISGERSPLFNDYAKGMFIGMSSTTGRQQLARAVFEGTAFAVRHNFDEAAKLGARPEFVASSGGGAKSRIWTQIRASVLNIPIKVLENEDADRATLGNAMFAAVGIGMLKDINSVSKRMVKYKEIVEPNVEWVKIYDDIYPLYRSMYIHLEDDLKRLHSI